MWMMGGADGASGSRRHTVLRGVGDEAEECERSAKPGGSKRGGRRRGTRVFETTFREWFTTCSQRVGTCEKIQKNQKT